MSLVACHGDALGHDLYGIQVDDLEQARVQVEAALGVSLRPHESSYHGGDYFRLGAGGGRVARRSTRPRHDWLDPLGQWAIEEAVT